MRAPNTCSSYSKSRNKVSDFTEKMVLNQILKTREVRQALTTIVSELMAVWADKNRWKKSVSKTTAHIIAKQLSQPQDALEKEELATLFENQAFVEKIAVILAPAVPAVVAALSKSVAALDKLTVEDKKVFVQKLFLTLFKGQSGALIKHVAGFTADIHQADPDFLARCLKPGVVNWLESMDFGEVKEAADSAVPCLIKLVSMLNDAIWQYPSKIISIFALIPPLFETASGALSITLKKINQLSPDLLTDLIISLLKEVNGKVIADLINQIMEAGRKILTGSALLGEPGSPQLPKALDQKISEIVSNLDVSVFWQGHLAFSHIKASYETALLDAMENDPANLDLEMINRCETANLALQVKNRKMAQLDEMDDRQLSEHLAQFFSAYDLGESVEYFNLFLRLFNRFSEEDPKAVTALLHELINAIDEEELVWAVKNVFTNFNHDLQSVARSLLPDLVIWGCDILKAEDDEYEEKAAQARMALRSLLSA